MKAGWIGFPRKGDDFWESLELYAKMGYKGMEGGEALLGKGNDGENIARFHELGLTVLTASTSVDELKKGVEPVIERAKLLQTNRVTIWASPAMYSDLPPKANFYAEIEAMETAATAMAKENIQLCYHNHEKEFQRCYNNVMILDHMVLNTRHLKIELDVMWATWAKMDPIALLKRYGNRIAAVHIKDCIGTPSYEERPDNQPTFTALGTGLVDIRGVLQCMHGLEHEWVVYEQDNMRNLSANQSMALSYLYMKETGLVE